MRIVGRKAQIAELQSYLKSEQSEFVAVYGRRRVGKTYLIKNLFDGMMSFSFTAVANANTKQQLNNFQIAMQEHTGNLLEVPGNWLWAFKQLKDYLLGIEVEKKIIFIDELPYLDTPKSDFMAALEHFWNSWAAFRNDIILIVCGSSTSWIVNKLINNKGGLHNRITRTIRLLPFTLGECEEYLQSRSMEWERYDIAVAYMVLGGIPWYWSLLKKGKSIAQNIDLLFFSEQKPLASEFKNLYASLFKNHEKYVEVIRFLSGRKSGYTRDEIIKHLKKNSGGGLSTILDDLELCGFVSKIYPPKSKAKNAVYVLSDFYTLFYFDFIADNSEIKSNWWTRMQNTPKLNAWQGFTFEQVCIYHHRQIVKALDIAGIETSMYPLRTSDAQIDIVIERGDRSINLCEVKFTDSSFSIGKDYSMKLRNKIASLRENLPAKRSIFLTMITTFGVVQNMYYGLVQNEVVLDDLFRE